MRWKKSFRIDLASILNKHSIDNKHNIPDFILAEYLINCLENLINLNNKNKMWKSIPIGKSTGISQDLDPNPNVNLDRPLKLEDLDLDPNPNVNLDRPLKSGD